ncbi:MAG: 3-deoxy-7-phosphoheptulonate synthase class II [Planctomycetota bacterium]|nr:3-deoxy-7-phosphoheptulonate synthase class II [Planctomycetota bacterium]
MDTSHTASVDHLTGEGWTPSSWTRLPARQQPPWPNEAALARTLETIASMPPLVTSWEIESLKERLALAGQGRAFVLQGGDCAESFSECHPEHIADMLKVLLKMSLLLLHGSDRPVVRIGRVAGQYAKPRSSDTETRGDVTLPTYRGDNVNRPGFTAADRTPDPELLVRGHERAALTLNFIRALAVGGFADLHHAENWDLSFVQHSEFAEDYRRIVKTIVDGVRFIEVFAGHPLTELAKVDIWTSHECLLLQLEQAMTRTVPRRAGWYNLSTHMPWVGVRTSVLGEAHIEYLRGICNPVGIKIDAQMTPQRLVALVRALNPAKEPGKIVLIHRIGCARIAEVLPKLLSAVQGTGDPVVWLSDPMHGNTGTVQAPDGQGGQVAVKTRSFEDIVSEIEQALSIHAKAGVPLGGVHLEFTGENVTECIGGASGITANDLGRAYRSNLDPRLNYDQSLELAMRMARHLRRTSGG